VKYAFMKHYRQEFPLSLMCKVLKASRSGYYDWLGRGSSDRSLRKQKLTRAIEDIFNASRKTYGSPRVHNQLLGLGFKVSPSTVAKIMKENGLRSKVSKKFKVKTTDSKHSFPIAKNVVNQNFEASKPNEIWLSDVTFVETREGWLYLASILDLCTRKIVGWEMSDRNDRWLTLSALEMAVKRSQPSSGVVFHSDRGSNYACYDFQNRLHELNFIPSMSSTGNCYDNAPKESFFHTLKTEFVHHEDFLTRGIAKTSIFEWIEVFYNRLRIHSSLGYKTPIAFEEKIMLRVA